MEGIRSHFHPLLLPSSLRTPNGSRHFETSHPVLVRRALSLLWAANKGLSGPEWLDLLGEKGQPLPRADWTGLFLAMEPHLSQQAGLYSFGHAYLREAVEEVFLPDAADQRAAHLALAEYFQEQETSSRQVDELPWHLRFCEERRQLRELLLHLPFCFAVLEQDENELLRHWIWLGGDFTTFQFMAEDYLVRFQEWIEKQSDGIDLLDEGRKLAHYLFNAGCFEQSEKFYRFLLQLCDQELGSLHPSTLHTINNLAKLKHKKGDYKGAQHLYERALETCENVLGPEHLVTLDSLNNLARLLYDKSDYETAYPLYERALEASKRVLGPEHPNTLILLSNIATLLEMKGDFDTALTFHEQVLEASELALGPEHPHTLGAINNLAYSLTIRGEFDTAQTLYERLLACCERVLGQEHPDAILALDNFAIMLDNKGEHGSAMLLHKRNLEARKRILGPEHPDTLTSLHNLAVSLGNKGDFDAAQLLLEQVLKTNERIHGPEHISTLMNLQCLAIMLKNKGDYDAALPILERVYIGYERLLGPHPYTLVALDRLAELRDKIWQEEQASLHRLLSAIPASEIDLSPEEIRSRALDCYNRGQLIETEALLHLLLATGFERSNTYLLLARVLLMTDRNTEAQQHIEQAWNERSDAQPYMLARILWMQILFALLDKEEIASLLGNLKALLQVEDVHMEWTMQPVLDHLQARLQPDDLALLSALVAALSSEKNMPALDAFPRWQEAEPLPLE